MSDGPDSAPRPRRISRDRGRWLFIIAAIVVVGLILFARVFSGFYVDYLWHQSLDRTDVFWGVWRAKLLMFVLFAGVFISLAVLNLIIADRLAPQSFAANTHPLVERFHLFFGRRLRLARIGAAVLVGLLAAAPAVARWQDWLMFRNSQSFGINDPEFGQDVGFYLFRMPFITFVIDWLFAALILVLLLVIATHVLSGGIVIQPPRPKARRATKAHIAVLLAVLALVKAADYWVARYELTSVSRGIVRGPTYAVVNAQLPAVVLLGLVAVFVAALYLYTLRSDSWRLPLVGSALWVVIALAGGVIYPAAVQALVVTPNQRGREAPYIERNVLATRQALGIDNVEVRTIEFGELTTSEVEADPGQLEDPRLINVDLEDRFRNDQGDEAGLTINDLDPDRYVIDGREQQVMVAARELDLNRIPNKSWQGRHLISTHGCGLVLAPADRVSTSGGPQYVDADLDRPELYFGEQIEGYAIVKTDEAEAACPGQATGPYEGSGGVPLSSGFRRLMFAINYLDYNLIGSSAVGNESRLLSIRDVDDRVRKLAPFLTFDGDPYPVQSEGGVLWVIDAYTTSNRYPYGETIDRGQLDGLPNPGLNQEINYVRNSVKATVDAYDGTVRFYVVDDTDPVLRVWRSAFPDLFTPFDQMPADVLDNLRYPEELFRVQTSAYSKYRLDPAVFFERDGAWSVAQEAPQQPPPRGAQQTEVTPTTEAPVAATPANDFAREANTPRFVPYYTMFHVPDSDDVTFALYRPFVPFSQNDARRELQAFMTATWSADAPAALTVYEVENAALPAGPGTIAAEMSADSDVSVRVTQLNDSGSQVIYGDMQMVPVGDGLLWIRPLYVAPTSGARLPQLQHVIAYYDGDAVLGDSLQDAIERLFPGFDGDLAGGSGGGGGGEEPEPTDETAAELLARADELFAEAEADLRDNGRLGAYQQKIEEATALVQQALRLLEDEGSADG